MAVYRETPKCPICGKPTAKSVYDTKSEIIGDRFIRWDYINHPLCSFKLAVKSVLNSPKIAEAIREWQNRPDVIDTHKRFVEWTKEMDKKKEKIVKSGQLMKDFEKEFYYNWTGTKNEFYKVRHWIAKNLDNE